MEAGECFLCPSYSDITLNKNVALQSESEICVEISLHQQLTRISQKPFFILNLASDF